ncbi:expressed protein [Echinococcus multilocularis]|uniref:Expressed protein n=1 Tax=Echinococcus multilocularis TaxID=6211 RepID=A0A068Y7X8_ECHMU|nr:expressed protein [Echinococcus multilocularis]
MAQKGGLPSKRATEGILDLDVTVPSWRLDWIWGFVRFRDLIQDGELRRPSCLSIDRCRNTGLKADLGKEVQDLKQVHGGRYRESVTELPGVSRLVSLQLLIVFLQNTVLGEMPKVDVNINPRVRGHHHSPIRSTCTPPVPLKLTMQKWKIMTHAFQGRVRFPLPPM